MSILILFSLSKTQNFYDQPIDSDIKRSREIRLLTAEQGEDYTTGCFLDHEFIKNHYRLIKVDLSRQKELDPDPKTIHQIVFVGQLKMKTVKNVDGTQSIFALTILEKIKEARLTFSQESLKVGKLWKSKS